MELLEYNLGTAVRAFSTMRGEGSGNYGGFNITHYCGDNHEHVTECRKQLCRQLNIEEKRLILPRQTHGNNICCIDEGFMQLQPQEQQRALDGIDAVITAQPHTCIGVSTADCTPVLMYDSRQGVIAAIHAGWRGTVEHIVWKCITAMKEEHGCMPSYIKAVIAPCISQEAFEVGNEVYEAFKEKGFPMERIAKLYPTRDGAKKWHIDLKEANRLQILAGGIPENNIQVSGICTYGEHGRFFSARRLGIESGRIFNGIMLL